MCDTEFTDFKNLDLISLGIVSEDGNHEFYVENTSHIADYRSDFVNQVVMPLTDMAKFGKSYDVACLDLHDWLNQLPDEHIMFIVDFPGDWQILGGMLNKHKQSKKLQVQMMTQAYWDTLHERGFSMTDQLQRAMTGLMEGPVEYWRDIDQRQHHALVDAKAARHGWLKGLELAK